MNNFIKSKFILLFAFIFFMQPKVYAKEEDNIKIGLKNCFNNTSKIEINNNSILISYDKSAKEEIIINKKVQFCVTLDKKNYTKTGEIYNIYEKAKESLENYTKMGEKGVIAFFDEGYFEIYLENNINNMVNKKERLILKDGEENIILFENSNLPVIIKDINNNFIDFGNKLYRGFIEIILDKNIIEVINVLNIEEYLYSVVASEMQSNWNIEALKAQAVASRTYAYFMKNAKQHKFYDLCDNVHCQAYLGKNAESENSILAVESTKGIKAYYEGNIINSTYFSSSGGVTENSQNVWEESLPYLSSVKDIHEKEGKLWTRSISFKEIEEELLKKEINIGGINFIDLEKNETGRVKKLIIYGENKNYEILKENIRTFFKFTKEGPLLSRNFDILKDNYNNKLNIINNNNIYENNNLDLCILKEKGDIVNINIKNHPINIKTEEKELKFYYDDSYKNVDNKNFITIKGKGYGHGVGMSQYGAKAMADNSYKFDEILKFYFKNIELK